MLTIQNNITERDFTQQVRDLAQLLGWAVYHTWVAIRSPKGFPDLVMVRSPRLLFAELKSEKGTLTDAQVEWLEALRTVPGVEVYLWQPGDWDEIVRILKKEDTNENSY